VFKVLKIYVTLFLGLYMTHKTSKNPFKHKIIADIANFFDKPIRRIKTSLKLRHTSTGTAVAAVSNQKNDNSGGKLKWR
jgi:hypothetical protein